MDGKFLIETKKEKKQIDGIDSASIAIKKCPELDNKESIVSESKLEGARKRPRTRCHDDENDSTSQNMSSN